MDPVKAGAPSESSAVAAPSEGRKYLDYTGSCALARQGDVPLLIPARFLTALGAVMTCLHLKIMHMKLGVKQSRVRLISGHVAVSVAEFGRGYHAPASFACARSQIWLAGNARSSSRWRRLLLQLFYYSSLQAWQELVEVSRGPQPTPRCTATSSSARTFGVGSSQIGPEEDHLSQSSGTLTKPRADPSDRLRPRAMIVGHGKCLVTELEDSASCRHEQTSHGANRF